MRQKSQRTTKCGARPWKVIKMIVLQQCPRPCKGFAGTPRPLRPLCQKIAQPLQCCLFFVLFFIPFSLYSVVWEITICMYFISGDFKTECFLMIWKGLANLPHFVNLFYLLTEKLFSYKNLGARPEIL